MRGMIGSAHESILGSAGPDRAAWFPHYVDVLREHLAGGRSVRLSVSGTSMRPTIHGEATLVVVGGGQMRVGLGDVLVYHDAGRLISHRVMWRRRSASGHAVLTKGDGVTLPPAWVAPSAILGRVAAIETRDGRQRLDGCAARVHGLAIVARAWAAYLGPWLARRIRSLTMPARPA